MPFSSLHRRRLLFESLESHELLAVSTVDQWVAPVVFNDSLFYAARTAEHGIELWKSNGTETGTALLKDIRLGPNSSDISQLTVVGNTLFFTANNGTHGVELWKTDGTTNGTVMVKDIYPGATGSGPDKLTAVGNTLFFIADDGVHGTELWKSDCTANGTIMVRDINPGTGNSNPAELTMLGNHIFFTANDGVHGVELWKSDGTTNGTTLVKDIRSGVTGSNPFHLTAYKGKLAFAASDEQDNAQLFLSDGTVTGTNRVIPYKILPVARIANASSLSVQERCSLPLSASPSLDPLGKGLTYLWDLQGNGNYVEYAGDTVWFSAEKLNGKPGAKQTVRLKIRDAEGNLSDAASIDVAILDVPPTYYVNHSDLITGQVSRWEFFAVDVPSDAVMKWVINWGDDTETTINGGPRSRVSESHLYRTSGNFTVTIRTTDLDGIVSTVTLGIYVTSGTQVASQAMVQEIEMTPHRIDSASSSETIDFNVNLAVTMRQRQMLDLDQSGQKSKSVPVAALTWEGDELFDTEWIRLSEESKESDFWGGIFDDDLLGLK